MASLDLLDFTPLSNVDYSGGDTLIAETQEVSKNDKSAVYNINITNQDNIEVAHFKGKVYRTKREWFPNN